MPVENHTRIAIDPSIRFGKPCVKGTRITVEEVLELVRASISDAEIIRDYYPDLTVADIHACKNFAVNPNFQVRRI